MFIVTYRRRDDLTAEECATLDASEERGVELEDCVQVCAALRVSAVLRTENGQTKFRVDAKGGWRAA